MEWTATAAGDALVARPVGRVDEATWEAFLAHLREAVATAVRAGVRVVLDLAEVDYMSSRGLRALTLAKRDADAGGVAMVLARPNDRMREILAISRYDKIFAIVDSADAAP